MEQKLEEILNSPEAAAYILIHRMKHYTDLPSLYASSWAFERLRDYVHTKFALSPDCQAALKYVADHVNTGPMTFTLQEVKRSIKPKVTYEIGTRCKRVVHSNIWISCADRWAGRNCNSYMHRFDRLRRCWELIWMKYR